MNVEPPVVGVFNCIICGVILYLTIQNLNGSKIYQTMLEILPTGVFKFCFMKSKIIDDKKLIISDKKNYRFFWPLFEL